ncbi:hypothetical protein E2C01_070448 [Portunus trituberculatus]|uniref:Uncharacterized protein n=1 Tax=Portunus trituberculatus TaxID=210409 RepID=A0A5B7I3J1_PORTR|nr:hypothetical protein [Portunus trituberculatus]
MQLHSEACQVVAVVVWRCLGGPGGGGGGSEEEEEEEEEEEQRATRDITVVHMITAYRCHNSLTLL